MKKDDLFIVKVQISIMSSDGQVGILIYDKQREHVVELHAPSKESVDMIGLDSNVLKSFYTARLVENEDNPGTYTIELLQKIKDEKW